MHRIRISGYALGALFLFARIALGQTCDPPCGSGESCCENLCLPSIGFLFNDVTSDSGITPTQSSEPSSDSSGPGVAAADFDNDGYIDLFIPQKSGVADLLYRNLGDGTYEEIASELGLASIQAGVAALWIDYDNDRKLDLFVVDPNPNITIGQSMARLFHNEYDTVCRTTETACFRDVTDDCGLSGLIGGGALGGMAAGDVNNDGFVDVYVNNRRIAFLFVNLGTGKFENKISASGITAGSIAWQPIMADFNTDGWLDIYQNEDGRSNRLWINQKTTPNPTFVNEIPCFNNPGEECDQPLVDGGGTDMGITLGDIDNDGDLDLHTSNVFPGALLRNEGNAAQPGGVGGAIGVIPDFVNLPLGWAGWGWGTTFMDADNDGLVDLVVTNGTWNPAWPVALTDRTTFFHNVFFPGGSSQFVVRSVGIGDEDLGVSFVAFDSDRDGDLDSFQTGNSLFPQFGPPGLLRLREIVQCNGRNYLVVKPRTYAGNHFGIGAIVRVTTLDGQNPRTMMRIITAGTSFYGQEPAEAFFGLDDATLVNITVEWPDDDTIAGQNGTVETTDLPTLHINSIIDPIGYRSLTVCPEPTVPFDDCDDCNRNGILDACDIANGISSDGNGNSFPDECEFSDPPRQDFDGNGVPDECEYDGSVTIDIELFQGFSSPFTRCLTIVIKDCTSDGSGYEAVVETDVTYTAGPTGNPWAQIMLDDISTDATFISVKDSHTVGRRLDLEPLWDGSNHADAKFVNAANKALLDGNVSGGPCPQDCQIDILDFGNLIAKFLGSACNSNPNCCVGSDYNADGVIDLLDFSFIAFNFFKTDEWGCEEGQSPIDICP